MLGCNQQSLIIKDIMIFSVQSNTFRLADMFKWKVEPFTENNQLYRIYLFYKP